MSAYEWSVKDVPKFVPRNMVKQYFLSLLLSALYKPTPPQPLGRTSAYAADYDSRDALKGIILHTLSELLTRWEDLPSNLVSELDGFPTIDPKSTPDDIDKANDAASKALVIVTEGMTHYKIPFTEIDRDRVKGRPSQAYFVLHHSETYDITVSTVRDRIDEMYAEWLKKAGFAQ